MSGKTYAPKTAWDPQVHEYLESAFGLAEFAGISQALCRPPCSTCVRVNTLKTAPQDVVQHVGHSNGLVGSSPERQPFIHPLVPTAVMLPGEGPCTIDYSVTGGKELVVSRKTGEAVLRGAPVYAPGVLACSSGVNRGDLVAVSVAVEMAGSSWCGITRGTVLDSTHSARQGVVDRSNLFIGIGRAAMSRVEMFRADNGTAVVMDQPVFRVPSVTGLEGLVMLQNLPSVVAAHVLGPAPGSRVLDMCAAPGGKTTMMAQLMGDRGTVIALDRSHAKVSEILSLAQELSLTCIQAYRMDATKALQTSPPQPTSSAPSTCQPAPPGEAQGGLPQSGTDGSLEAGVGQQDEAEVGEAGPCTNSDHPSSAANAQQADGSGPEPSQIHKGHGGLGPEPGKLCTAQAGHPLQEATPQPSTVADHQNSQPAGHQSNGGDQRLSDKAAKRLQRKRDARLARGLPPAPPTAADLAAQRPSCSGFPPESFDYILLDAPCSALGLRPRLLQTATLTYLHQCAAYGRRLLDTAVQLLQPGGFLVYSTCTISPGENEANVRYVLDSYQGVMQLVEQEPRVGGPGLVGQHPLVHLTGGNPEVWLTSEQAQLVQRFNPAGAQDTIGFFVAKFKKIGPVP